MLPAGVVEGDVENAVTVGTDVDHARSLCVEQQRHYTPRQLEMTQVIDTQLKLKSVLGSLEGREHHSRVVDQDIDPREAVADLSGGRTNACQVVQFRLDRLDRRGGCLGCDGFSRRPKTLRVPPGEDDSGGG